jgi:hypothetical protein
MNELPKELRDLAWIASIVTGLSDFGIGLAVTLVMALERLPAGIGTL